MTEPVKTFSAADGETLYQCHDCRRAWSSLVLGGDGAQQMARDCCRPPVCSDCSEPATSPGRTLCPRCLDTRTAAARERAFAGARHVDFDTALGDDEFYEDPDTGDGARLDDDLDLDPGTRVWLCDMVTPALDVEDLCEGLRESLELGSEFALGDCVRDLDALVAAIDAWNAAQKPSVCRPGSRTRYVTVPEGESDE